MRDADGRFLQAGWLPWLQACDAMQLAAAAIASHTTPIYKVAPPHVTSFPAA